ncbi:MAG: CAP domain-containing protein [Candidatus Kapabacteria bacterium]|nr:CAP domain-containing protein [Candidatus Kapabacteria bacterium]
MKTVILLAIVLVISSVNGVAQIRSTVGGKTSGASTSVSEGVSSLGDARSIEQEVFRLVNKYRTNRGLKALEWYESIAAVCRKHSQNMASKKTKLGHDGFEKRKNQLVATIDFNSIAENVAGGNFVTLETLVEQWVNSNDHRVNMEGDYTNSGIGVALTKKGAIFITQIFVK